MFGATHTVKDNNKSKYAYSGYGKAFDGKGERDFGHGSARNVLIVAVGNNSLSDTDNRKNNFLVLGEGDTFRITGSFGLPEKKSDINFSKGKTKFCLSLNYNGDNNYLFVNGKKIYQFMQIIKILIFQVSFV